MRCFLLLLALLLPVVVAAQPVTLESPVTQNSGRFGQEVAFGDVDGDGAAEVFVATRQSEPSSENATGAGRVYGFAADGTLLLTLNPPAPEPDGSFGQALAVAGDADGDGGRDVFVCAPNEDPEGIDRAGQLHVFSGATGALLRSQPSPNPEEGAFFCSAAATVGDLDGDGQPDLLVGAASEDGGAGNAGRVYAFSSATGAVIHTLASPNAFATSRFGGTLGDAGDVDGDGVSDLLISAQGEPVDGVGGSGRVYVFSGSDGALLDTFEALDPNGEAAFGSGLAAAGDLDADGTSDLFVAATIRSGESGVVHALSGADGTPLYTITSPSDQEDDAFANGFHNGLAAVPDFDGDGLAEVLVGAPGDATLGDDAGRAYLFSGADGELIASFASPNGGFISRFGATLAAADATGDGRPDLLIGAPTENANVFAGGRAYLFSDPVGTLLEDPSTPTPLNLSVAPNPAQGATSFRLVLAAPGPVHLAVYDLLGRRLAVPVDRSLPAGVHRVSFDGTRLPSGVYLVRVHARDGMQSQPFVLLR